MLMARATRSSPIWYLRTVFAVVLFLFSHFALGQYPSTCFPAGSAQCQAFLFTSETFQPDSDGYVFASTGKNFTYSEEEAFLIGIKQTYVPHGIVCRVDIILFQDWHPAFITRNGSPDVPVIGGVELRSEKNYHIKQYVTDSAGSCNPPEGFIGVSLWRYRAVGCQAGYSRSPSATHCERAGIDAAKMMCCSDTSQVNAGNPINAGLGNKFQIEADYSGLGPFPLRFSRTFNSGGPCPANQQMRGWLT